MEIKPSRICIVTARNIFDAPCLEKYKEIIKEPFDIIYWDRCEINEECGATNYFKYNGPLRTNSGKLKKIKPYIGYFRFANRILKKYKYEKLIVFPTQAGWLVQRSLCKKYKGKYVLDIRDYAGENHFLIAHMTEKIVNNAGLCSITSPAYQNFLPKRDYVISHNIQPVSEELIRNYRMRERKADEPIVLSFIGSVRFIEQQKRIIQMFRNDPRFHLKYIGRGSEQLEDFCKRENIKNVTLIGRFERERLSEFYIDTDIAINVYGNHDPYLDYALSNKLYSAAMMGMPILVSPNTYMAELSGKFGFGIEFDLQNNDCVNDVAAYFENLDRKALFSECDRFINEIKIDEELYRQALENFLSV